MREYEHRFKEFLKSRELKLTESRRKILEAAFSLSGHFDAEKLYDKIKDRKVSLATVYRTLPLLMEAGLIQPALRMEGRDRFERTLGHPKHVHWVCDKCKSVQESELGSLKSAIEKEAKALKFELDQISINISGLCWKCRTNDNESQ